MSSMNWLGEFFEALSRGDETAVVLFVVGMLVVIYGVLFLFLAAFHIAMAIPVYALAKKADRKNPWFAWIPFFQFYLLTDIPGDKPLHLLGDRIVIKKRATSFWIYLGLSLLNVCFAFVVALCSTIPVVGGFIYFIGMILIYIPSIAMTIMLYAYLRDVLNLFKEDREANRTLAIVVTVLDSVVTSGIARIVCLYTLMKKEPLPQPEEEPIHEKAWVIGK